MTTDLGQLARAIEAGDRTAAGDLTSAAIAAGVAPAAVLASMTGAMDAIGARFSDGEIYVPEMLLAARAMKAAMAILEPELVAANVRPAFTAVIGTVKGDLHDIGKNLVATIWKGSNIGVVDLGVDVEPAAFVEGARIHGASLVGISALLTTTMPGMREAVAAIRVAGLPGVRVMVGGAPVTPAFAAEIGADGYAADAAEAVTIARRLVGIGA